jgi:hypothetical protein
MRCMRPRVLPLCGLRRNRGQARGQEIDTQGVYSYNKQIQLAMGFAHIFPGEFLQKATPGKSYNFPYVMLGYSF